MKVYYITPLEKANYLIGIVFGLTAAYHLLGLFIQINDASLTRHLVFVLIDIFCAYGFINRPNFFNFFFAAFTLQQYYSHGSQLIAVWITSYQIHWISVLAIFWMTLAMAKLLVDYFSVD